MLILLLIILIILAIIAIIINFRYKYYSEPFEFIGKPDTNFPIYPKTITPLIDGDMEFISHYGPVKEIQKRKRRFDILSFLDRY